MLPRLPKSESYLSDFLLKRFTRMVHQAGSIGANLKHAVIHEGKTAKVTNGDWEDEIGMRRMETSFFVRHRDIQELNFHEIIRRWDEAARDMGRQKEKILFDKLNQVIDSTGNTIHESDTVESIFKMIESVDLDFLEDGALAPGFQIVAGPQSIHKIDDAFKKIENNVELRKRWELLLETKRNEWRDREASRALVE